LGHGGGTGRIFGTPKILTGEDAMLLLDTNIVSYFIYNADWKRLYVPILRDNMLFISFMTLAEMLESAYHRRLSERNLHLFNERMHTEYLVIPWDDRICEHFARIRFERRNRPISVSDALIAATALTHKLPLVTHNAKDFTRIDGLQLITCYKE
jgi:tRNA(fMet)-specific endonuclease VapC